MKIDNIKGIFFDIGYTLCEPMAGDWRFTTKFYELIDKDTLNQIPQERIIRAFQKSSKYLDDNHFLKTLQEEYEQNIVAYTLMADELPELNLTHENIKTIAYDRTFNMSNYRFYDDVKTTLEKLSKNFKLGVISDTWPSADNMLIAAGVHQYFSTFTYSCFLGTYKPDQIMYEDAINQMGFQPEQTIFIDDSIKNLEAAKKMGIIPILYTTRVDQWDGIMISKISDLLEYM